MSHDELFIKLIEWRIQSNLLLLLERWFEVGMTYGLAICRTSVFRCLKIFQSFFSPLLEIL